MELEHDVQNGEILSPVLEEWEAPLANQRGHENDAEPEWSNSKRMSIVEKYGSAARLNLKRKDSLMEEASYVKSMQGRHLPGETLPWSVNLRLAFQTIGVVYGDLGTSPLYVYASAFSGASYNKKPSEDDILGALSLILYTFTLLPLVKYCFIVLRANDHGQGGTFALYSLIARYAKLTVSNNQHPEDHEVSSYKLDRVSKNVERSARLKGILQRSKVFQKLLVIVTIMGTCSVMGDGILTPAISVLSAVEGLRVNSPSIPRGVVVGVTCAILVLLFSVQRFGTDKVGYTFAPAVLTWFISIALIGIYNIVTHDTTVFRAFNPYYIYLFFARNRKQGWISLGGIVLCVTGTEAMFADLGHFSVRAIQTAFTTIVYPCLVLAYIGQAAYLLEFPEHVDATFYKSIPDAVYWPMFAVATAAAIIASQAMISATFSIIDQAMALGCFPRVKVVHTSEKYFGQIYIPELNWLIMTLTVLIAAGFQDTTQIGNAYGIAVVATFSVTTNLTSLIMVLIWQKNIFLAMMFWGVFASIELTYLSSVLFKVPQGGWVPLAFVGIFFTVMFTWYYGRSKRYDYEVKNKVSLDWVLGLGSNLGMVRVPGIGLVYSELAQGVPTIFAHLITNLPAMHSIIVFVCVKYLPVPKVPDDERFLMRRIGPNGYRMYRCAVRFGYKDKRSEDDNFEKILFESMVKFILSEESQAPTELGLLIEESDAAVPPVLEGKRLSGSSVSGSDGSSGRFKEVGKERVNSAEEELAVLEQAREAGIVYLLGHTEARAMKDSSWFRKFVIDKMYNTLRRNCRGSVVALSIPHSSLLQVGMIHSI